MRTSEPQIGMSDPAVSKPGGSPLPSARAANITSQAIRNLFAAVAPRYDLLNHLLSFGRDIAWRKTAARALSPVLRQPGSLVLDVCCGTGDLTLALARLSQGTIVGSDFCRPMLVRAQSKARCLAKQPPLVEADALALPFRDRSLDAVAVAFGFRNLADYTAGLREMKRVLKPEGTVVILEFSEMRWPVLGHAFALYFRWIVPRLGRWLSGVRGAYDYLVDSVMRFPDQESLAAALREAGFTGVSFVNLTGGIAALHIGRKARPQGHPGPSGP